MSAQQHPSSLLSSITQDGLDKVQTATKTLSELERLLPYRLDRLYETMSIAPTKKLHVPDKAALDELKSELDYYLKNEGTPKAVTLDFLQRRYAIEKTLGRVYYAKYLTVDKGADAALQKERIADQHLYHLQQSVEVPLFFKGLGLLNKRHKILDIGTGYGLAVKNLRRQGFDAYGIDSFPFAAGEPNYLYHATAEDFAKNTALSYDLITFLNFSVTIWQNYYGDKRIRCDFDGIFKPILQMLNPDGKLVLGIAYYDPYYLAGHRVLMPQLYQYFERVDLITMRDLEKAGLIPEDQIAIGSMVAFFICTRPLK